MKTIHKVCVVGAGSMGRQIALNAAVSGFEVRVKTSKPEQNLIWCTDFLDKGIAKGKYDEAYKTSALSRLSFVTTMEEALKGVDLVIESVLEDRALKTEIFTQINELAPKDAIIATNSSYMASSEFADLITPNDRLANLHYFNPAMVMKLVEVVRGPHTSDETVHTLQEFAAAVGKKYITVNKEIEGFIVNRLLRAIQNEAFFLYKEGYADYKDIDLGEELGLNHPLGPFRLMDLTGIDLCYMGRQGKYEKTGNPADEPPAFLKEKYETGEYGRKTGKGWYDYSK